MRTMIRASMRAAAVVVLSLLLSSAVAASAAADGGDGQDASLHIGVRAIAVGEPIPVTVVEAEPGSTWEIREQSTGDALGVLTVGADGTGTATVSLPLDTDLGSAELVAVSGGLELSAGASVGSSASHDHATTAAPPSSADAGDPVAVAIAGIVALGAIALVIRTRRRAAVGPRKKGTAS
jgi:5'-nucleotidase